jgi:hypothetical protein
MNYKLFSIYTLAFAAIAKAAPQESGFGGLIGNLAKGIVTSSNGVALGPAPKGCSKYEIIVGMYLGPSQIVYSPSTARGTAEPGPYGLIVGDPLVNSVTKAIPGSRGYAVQVCDSRIL